MGSECTAFNPLELAAACEQKLQEYNACEQECKDKHPKDNEDRKDCMSSCEKAPECDIYTSNAHPVIGFTESFQSWQRTGVYVVGNLVRLAWLGVSTAEMTDTSEFSWSVKQLFSWLLPLSQDGFAYACTMFVAQLSYEDDCLEVDVGYEDLDRIVARYAVLTPILFFGGLFYLYITVHFAMQNHGLCFSFCDFRDKPED